MKKNRLLIGVLGLVLAGMPIASIQAKDNDKSVIWTEMTKLSNDLSVWAQANPKTVNALGVGAVGGGLVGAVKLLGKRAMAQRTGRGAVVGAVTSAIVRELCEPLYVEAKKKNNYRGSVDEVCYEAGLTVALVVAALTA